MKVICEFCDGQELPKVYYQMGYSKKTIFDVKIGLEYPIYGISFWKKKFFI